MYTEEEIETLDVFATAAMNGLLAGSPEVGTSTIVSWAYDIAEEMLKVRKERVNAKRVD